MFDKHRGKKPEQTRTIEPGLTQSSSAPVLSSSTSAGKPAVIGSGIIIDGNISGSENLLIEGKVKGHINLVSNEVTIGQSGEVNANVSARVVRVAGKVNGDISGKEKVIINSTGNVRGNIVAPRMMLEDGAIFKGSIDMDPGENTQAKVVLPTTRAAIKPNSTPEVVTDSAKKNPDLALKSG